MERSFFITCEIWRTAYSVSDIIKDICVKIDENNYDIAPFSKGIDKIGVSVNCHRDESLALGWGKPRKYISYQKRCADIRLPLPYVEYINADYETQYLMVVKNIVDSIRIIGEKCRKSKRAEFDSDGLINDFLQRIGVLPEEIKDIVGVISDEQYQKIINPDS